MKKDLCELIVILDKSGSMHSVINDTIGGFNTFLKTQQNMQGDAKLTFVQFDTNYNIIYNGVDIKEVKPLDRYNYMPSGMTALLDAVGKTLDEVDRRLIITPEEEKPEKVIFLIITDGEENSSKEYTGKIVKEKTDLHKSKDNWEFVFMGADQDAWAIGDKLGAHTSVNYTVKDIHKTMKGAALYSSKFRTNDNSRGTADFKLSDQELDNELKKYDKNNKDEK